MLLRLTESNKPKRLAPISWSHLLLLFRGKKNMTQFLEKIFNSTFYIFPVWNLSGKVKNMGNEVEGDVLTFYVPSVCFKYSDKAQNRTRLVTDSSVAHKYFLKFRLREWTKLLKQKHILI